MLDAEYARSRNRIASMKAMPPVMDVIEIESLKVACEGGALGHPRVFLTIKPEVREVVCPYCSRHYVLKRDLTSSASH